MSDDPLLDDRPLRYVDGQLHMDAVALRDIAAAVGSPTYVYSATHIKQQIHHLKDAFSAVDHRIHYSVKANSNLAVLNLCRQQGCGFDIVSGGELSRVLAAGCDPQDVIFSGVGKSVEELDFALKAGIGCFNVESAGELQRLSARAANLKVVAPVSLRVNPDVDAGTHPYISTGLKDNKFGIPIEHALPLYQQAAADEYLHPTGIDCHIGSQITEHEPLLAALTSVLALYDALAGAGIDVEHIDLGGGMGIRYQHENALDVAAYGDSVAQTLGHRNCQILLEPGRSIVANAGVLLTRVEYLKPSPSPERPSFAVVDAAMNDLIRPALYQAWHDIVPVQRGDAAAQRDWDVVGPVCESGDFLGKSRPLALADNDLLCVCSAGAYGMVQASNYNSRGRAAEVLVDGQDFALVRRRETIDDQLRLEQFPV